MTALDVAGSAPTLPQERPEHPATGEDTPEPAAALTDVDRFAGLLRHVETITVDLGDVLAYVELAEVVDPDGARAVTVDALLELADRLDCVLRRERQERHPVR